MNKEISEETSKETLKSILNEIKASIEKIFKEKNIEDYNFYTFVSYDDSARTNYGAKGFMSYARASDLFGLVVENMLDFKNEEGGMSKNENDFLECMFYLWKSMYKKKDGIKYE